MNGDNVDGKPDDAVAIVKMTGEIEIGRKDEIHDALSVPAGAAAVLLDFSEITYADSTALAELLRFRTTAAGAGARIAIFSGAGNRRFTRLLAYAGLSEAFAVFEDRDAAVAFLTAAA